MYMIFWDTSIIVHLYHCRDRQYITLLYGIWRLDVVRLCDIASTDDFKVVSNGPQRVIFDDGNFRPFCGCDVID